MRGQGGPGVFGPGFRNLDLTDDQNAQLKKIAAAEADVMILNAKARQESLQVLTSEQQATLKEQRNHRQGEARQRRPRGQQ